MEQPVGWLDRWPWLAFVVLVVAPIAGHLVSFVTGLSSDPIWTVSAVVRGVGPSLVVGGAFGDPNVGWTNQALGHLAAQDWLHLRLPWWNPYSGVGLPLAGEMQPAALFLPFVLLLALKGGLFWLEVSLQVFTGISTFCLMRRLALGRFAALVCGLLFAFDGTFTCVPGETILNVIPFLPLLLHGIEDAREVGYRRRAVVLIALGVGGSILAGFPETAYIDGLMALAWALVRLGQTPDRRGFGFAVVLGGVIGLLIAAPQIVAFLDFSASSTVFQTHRLGGYHIPVRGFAVTMLPFVFGPLGTALGSKLLLSVSFSVCGYVGVLVVLFAVAGVVSRRDRPIAVMLALDIMISLAKIFGFAPAVWLIDLLPLMKEVSFWRYSSPAWELASVVLVGFALEDAVAGRMRLGVPLVVVGGLTVVSVALAWPWAAVWHLAPGGHRFMVGWFALAVGDGVGAVLLAWLVHARLGGAARCRMLGIILVGNAMALAAIPQLSGHRPGRIDRAAIGYLRAHLGLRRFYTLGPIEPNYGAYFGLASLNHNYLPVPRRWTRYVQRDLLPSYSSHSGNIFWAPFLSMSELTSAGDIARFIANYRYLGVRYVLGSPGMRIGPRLADPAVLGRAMGWPLYPRQSLLLRATAPAAMADMPAINEVGVEQGNYDHQASGDLVFRLCADGVCGVGARNLAESHDDVAFTVRLHPAVVLHGGERYRLTVTHRGGTSPDAIWLYRAGVGPSVLATDAGQVIAGRRFGVVFGRAAVPGRFRRVFADDVMTIWRLAGAAPFYSAGRGCRVADARLDAVRVVCAAGSTLVRRELFMAGWHVTDDGVGAAIMRHRGIVQAVALHPGVNRLAFRFAPPYSGLAWLAFWLGVAGLLWQGCGRWIISQRQRLRVRSR